MRRKTICEATSRPTEKRTAGSITMPQRTRMSDLIQPLRTLGRRWHRSQIRQAAVSISIPYGGNRHPKVAPVNIRQLRCFETVMALGTATEAAAALGVSQPAVSLAIASLEKELGFVLFER